MSASLQANDVLHDRYRILERIGMGGMGNIYQAEDLRLEGRMCAVKEVEHDRSVPANLLQEARQQFRQEATVLARLDHPNLPKVSDFFSIETRDYLVMDYIPGKDLRSVMLEYKQQKRFIPESDVLSWSYQLADALSYLHQQDPILVHRDVKPSNLKITPKGVLKLVDFGLVKALLPDELTITVIQGRGTALYTPLEQYGGDGIHTDSRSDIYAFGCTLYHLLTNTPPVDARQRFLHPESLVPPRKINPEISQRTERGMLWAMELHPNDRPNSIEEFRTFLIGSRELPPKLGVHSSANRDGILSMIASERIFLWLLGTIYLLTLLVSLIP